MNTTRLHAGIVETTARMAAADVCAFRAAVARGATIVAGIFYSGGPLVCVAQIDGKDVASCIMADLVGG